MTPKTKPDPDEHHDGDLFDLIHDEYGASRMYANLQRRMWHR